MSLPKLEKVFDVSGRDMSMKHFQMRCKYCSAPYYISDQYTDTTLCPKCAKLRDALVDITVGAKHD